MAVPDEDISAIRERVTQLLVTVMEEFDKAVASGDDEGSASTLAAGTMQSGPSRLRLRRWTGLDADARERILRLSKTEVRTTDTRVC